MLPVPTNRCDPGTKKPAQAAHYIYDHMYKQKNQTNQIYETKKSTKSTHKKKSNSKKNNNKKEEEEDEERDNS